MANNRPFTVKGEGFTTPKGKALWCKSVEPERKFNDKGDLMTSLICDPNDEDVKAFIKTLEELRDQAFKETCESLGPAKAKVIKARPVFQPDTDKEGNETGMIVFKLKLSNVDDKKEAGRQYKLVVVDAKKNKIEHPPEVGNGSTIRCAGFANPYYMASTKEVGVSLMWAKMQILDLVEFGGSDDFAEEDGYSASSYGTESLTAEEVPF